MILFALSLLILACQSQTNYPYVQKGMPLRALVPITTPLIQANTKLGTQFSVTHIQPVQLCIHRFPLTGISPLYWNISCNFYFPYPPSPNNVPITNQDTAFIRDLPYYFGISYLNLGDTISVDSIDLTIGQVDLERTQDTCLHGEIFDRFAQQGKPQCIQVNRTIQPNIAVPHSAVANEIIYYAFDISDNIGSIMARSDDNLNQMIFVFRRDGSPSDTRKDGTSGSIAYYEFPAPGRYYLSVKSLTNVRGTFSIQTKSCVSADSAGGPNCLTPYNNSGVGHLAFLAKGNTYNYWRVTVKAGSYMLVSVLPNNFDIWNYQLFARFGQLPQKDNADISNCYASNCRSVMSINITGSPIADQDWFIAVLPGESTTNQTYAIWFMSGKNVTSGCAPGCEVHGTCVESGDQRGLCICNSQYAGAACQLTDLKRAHTIVLIIIACLLGFSVIVVFVARAYLKRHKGYQAV